MNFPVGAYGRHDLLQHEPPQVGRSPPVVGPSHIWPAGVHPVAPATLTMPHVPSVAPAAFVHAPPQQSMSFAHASLFWMQNDEVPEQKPLRQAFEQQSPSAPHGLPDVLHDVLSGVHVPAHLPPQHSPSEVQAALSATHCFPEHLLFTHELEQHSVLLVHAPSATAHARPPADALTAAPSVAPPSASDGMVVSSSLPQPPNPKSTQAAETKPMASPILMTSSVPLRHRAQSFSGRLVRSPPHLCDSRQRFAGRK